MNSRAHLIPIKKAVFDRRKGFILRTYYVRPEYIEKIIRKFKGLEPEPKIRNFRGFVNILGAVKRDNPLFMKDEIEKRYGKRIWSPIAIRTINLQSITQSNPYAYSIQLADLSILSYVISNEKDFISKLRTHVKNASTIYKYNVKESVKEYRLKEQGKKIKTSKNVKRLIRILEKTSVPSSGNQDLMNETNPIPKRGVIKYKHSLDEIEEYHKVGKHISLLINAVYPHPIKVMNVLSKFITSSSINAVLAHIKLSPAIDFKDLRVKEDEEIKLYPYILLDVAFNYERGIYTDLTPMDLVFIGLYLRSRYDELYKKLPDSVISETENFIKMYSPNHFIDVYNDKHLPHDVKLYYLIFVLRADDILRLLMYLQHTSNGYIDRNEHPIVLQSLLNRYDVKTKDVIKYFVPTITDAKSMLTQYMDAFNYMLTKNQMKFVDPLIGYLMKIVRPSYIPHGNILDMFGYHHLSTSVIARMTASKYAKTKIAPNLHADINRLLSSNQYRDKVYLPIMSDEKSDYQFFKYLNPIEVAFKSVPNKLMNKQNVDFVELENVKCIDIDPSSNLCICLFN